MISKKTDLVPDYYVSNSDKMVVAYFIEAGFAILTYPRGRKQVVKVSGLTTRLCPLIMKMLKSYKNRSFIEVFFSNFERKTNKNAIFGSVIFTKNN